MKICASCHKEKPLSQFYKRKINKDGHQSQCKECADAYNRDYRDRNQDHINAYERNRQRSPARKAYRRSYYASNREKIKAHKSRYLDNNREKCRFSKLLYTAKRRGIHCDLDYDIFVELISLNACFYCGSKLSPTGCALDRIDNSKGYILGNVRACCDVCNTAKNNLSESDFKKWVERIFVNWFFRLMSPEDYQNFLAKIMIPKVLLDEVSSL